MWIALSDLADQPFPEGEGLGVRIVNSEDADALLNPEENDTFQFVPKRLPISDLEVKRVDVLVFLRWILCILKGTVRTPAELFWMFFYVWMIGRTVKCQI